MESAGEWLEASLNELSGRIDSGLQLDADLISGLVSFCELAPPVDAADYLTNIIGTDSGNAIIQEYLQRRGHVNPNPSPNTIQSHKTTSSSSKKPQTKSPQKAAPLPATKIPTAQPDTKNPSKKKKHSKPISLAEASKGSIVFQQGKPCSCQARRHNLVSNCLSCGKIVCEQEGEGPCSFCGALVLKEASNYAGLTDIYAPLSKEEELAEEFAKRLVDYDRNSAARTKVIDDQSDYFEIDGNSWLSNEEKQVLKKKQKEVEEAEEAKKKNLIITFDLVGRKVVLNKDEASELDSDLSILRPPEGGDQNRVIPNPTVKIQPVFVPTVNVKKSGKGKENKNTNKIAKTKNGLCLAITGRVQYDDNRQGKYLMGRDEMEDLKSDSGFGELREGDDFFDCSQDFN